jgi:hypothetical protein
MKDNAVFVVDIETSGPSLLSNGILSIGVCLGDEHGVVIYKRRFDAKLDEHHVYDPKCIQFWNQKGPSHVLKVIQQNPMKPKKAIQEFVHLLDACDTKYNLTIMSDNPSFDFSFLNYYMDNYMNRRPMNYRLKEHYRSLLDVNSFLKGRLGHAYKKKRNVVFPGVQADHFPENDAEYIYMSYIFNLG